jgi:5-methylcytosine-specific restriction enzyme subunit McrC
VISIRNLYVMLCYAWDDLALLDLAPAGTDADEIDGLDLLARVFEFGCLRVLRRGLDRRYVEVREESSTLHGRVLFTDSIRRLSFTRARAYTEYEELSFDTPLNRVVKATARAFIDAGTIQPQRQARIYEIYRRMAEVETIRLTPAAIAPLRISPLSRFYHVLVEVADLLCAYRIASEEHGGRRFNDFLRDERRMWVVFQRFVFNYCRRKQSFFKVRRPRFGWSGASKSDASRVALPLMETDIVLLSPGRWVIIDTKYTPKSIEQRAGATTLRSEHLYQLYAYIHNSPVYGSIPVDGLLIYPKSAQDLDAAWALNGCTLRAVAIDLAAPWADLDASLTALIAGYVDSA